MKKQLFIALSFVVAMGITSHLFAQENEKPGGKVKTKSNIKNDRVCSVTVTSAEGGCDIVFATEEGGGGGGGTQAKRQHVPIRYKVELDNSAHEVKSPRDPASGLATGKSVAGNPIGGLTIKGGKNPGGGKEFSKLIAHDGEINLPEDCDDGDYEVVLSWNWGASNPGGAKRGSASFSISRTAGNWDLATIKK